MTRLKQLAATTILSMSTLSIILVGNTYASQQNREQSSQKVIVEAKLAGKAEVDIEAKRTTPVFVSVVGIEEEYSSLEEVIEQMDYSMDMGKPCGLSKEDFVKLMEELPYDYTGFYSRNAEFIWEMEQEYQVNAIFYCGIVAQESGWGQDGGGCNNYTGMMCSSGLIYFETEEAGIETTFKNLGENYIPNGINTVSSIGTIYAGDTGWSNKVYSAMEMIVSH